MIHLKQKINSELEINLSTWLTLSDAWSSKNHILHLPKFCNLWRDVKPKWTQHTITNSPKIFSRNNPASWILCVCSAWKCFAKLSAFSRMHELIELRDFWSSFIALLANQNLLLLNLIPHYNQICMKCLSLFSSTLLQSHWIFCSC